MAGGQVSQLQRLQQLRRQQQFLQLQRQQQLQRQGQGNKETRLIIIFNVLEIYVLYHILASSMDSTCVLQLTCIEAPKMGLRPSW